MTRIEKYLELPNIPHYSPAIDEDELRIKCNVCNKVFIQSNEVQIISGFIYTQCRTCRP